MGEIGHGIVQSIIEVLLVLMSFYTCTKLPQIVVFRESVFLNSVALQLFLFLVCLLLVLLSYLVVYCSLLLCYTQYAIRGVFMTSRYALNR